MNENAENWECPSSGVLFFSLTPLPAWVTYGMLSERRNASPGKGVNPAVALEHVVELPSRRWYELAGGEV